MAFCWLVSVFLAFQFALPSVTYGSSAASGYTFGNNQPLDQASVSVVRLVATYTPTVVPTVPPAPPCTTTTVTGLGVLVGSWLTTASGTDYTNWVMSDGSLIDPNGLSCGTSKTTAALSMIQIYANDAYTNATGNPSSSLLQTLQCTSASCGDGTVSAPLLCQQSTPCAKGVVLIPFHSTSLQPFVDMATADQTVPAPFGIGLASPTSGTIAPSPTQANQFLTPVAIANASDPKNELGMPIINSLGQLQDMNTGALNVGETIRSYVTSQLTPGQGTHTNSLRASWNTGISDYYQANYSNAQTDFRNSGMHNQIFRAGVAFWTLATNKASLGNSGNGTPTSSKTPSAGHTPTAATGNINLFGVSIPDRLFTVLVAGLLVFLVILLVLITYAFVRYQLQQRKEFATLERSAKTDAMQIAQPTNSERSAFFRSVNTGSVYPDSQEEKAGERSALPVEREPYI